jgi:hypothetical protein
VIYRTEVWLNNKITVVVGDDRECFEKELARLEKLGGIVLAKYVQENDLDDVIVCTKKEAAAATTAKECPNGCEFNPVESDDKFCGLCGAELILQSS